MHCTAVISCYAARRVRRRPPWRREHTNGRRSHDVRFLFAHRFARGAALALAIGSILSGSAAVAVAADTGNAPITGQLVRSQSSFTRDVRTLPAVATQRAHERPD